MYVLINWKGPLLKPVISIVIDCQSLEELIRGGDVLCDMLLCIAVIRPLDTVSELFVWGLL